MTRVILAFDLNLYIPLSRVDANMQRAHSRNSAAKGKFFFRRHLAPLEEGDDGYGVRYVSMFSRAVGGDVNGVDKDDDETTTTASVATSAATEDVSTMTADNDEVGAQRRNAPCGASGDGTNGNSEEGDAYEEMSMSEIMTGKGDYFPGLIPLVRAYLDHIGCDTVTRKRLDLYLSLIEKRACGELVTPATWMRNFVRNHPDYQQDSHVSDELAYDLMEACRDIGLGKLHVPELLGNDIFIDPITAEGAYEVKLDSHGVQNDRLLALLRRYSNRQAFSSKSPL